MDGDCRRSCFARPSMPSSSFLQSKLILGRTENAGRCSLQIGTLARGQFPVILETVEKSETFMQRLSYSCKTQACRCGGCAELG